MSIENIRKKLLVCVVIALVQCFIYTYIFTEEKAFLFKSILGQDVRPWWDGGDCTCDPKNGQCVPRIPSLEVSIPQTLPSSFGSCSQRAAADGPHQKVVSFSLFGNNLGYWHGLSKTLAQVKLMYPGWKVWIYTNPRGRSKILCPLLKEHDHLRICDVTNLPYPLYNLTEMHNMIWRVSPLGDPLVDVFIVRDSDAMFLEREQHAVQEWLDSGKTFHIMRDHPYHKQIIMAGMWGANWDIRPQEDTYSGNGSALFQQLPTSSSLRDIRNRMVKMAFNHSNWGFDQDILMKVMWPETLGHLVAHDSYHCKLYPSGWMPWPTQRQNFSFVGNQGYRNITSFMNKTCPPECRPPAHQDWINC